MTKEEAYEKLDHTLCLNNNNNNIKFAISDIDCQSVEEMVDCLELIKPKHYIKWEDLEFDHKPKYIDVKMGDNKYLLIVGFSDGGNGMAILQTKIRRYYFVESEDNKQFFNDLHLEVIKDE